MRKTRRNKASQNQILQVILLKEEEGKFKKQLTKNSKTKRSALSIKQSSKRKSFKNYKKEVIKILMMVSRNKKLSSATRYNATNTNKTFQKTSSLNSFILTTKQIPFYYLSMASMFHFTSASSKVWLKMIKENMPL